MEVICDCCLEEIEGYYIDNSDGTYTCLSCDISMDESDVDMW